MIRPAILATLAATPAMAERCHYGVDRMAGTSVEIAPHDHAAAQLIIRNRLAFREHSDCTVTLGEVTAAVEYDPGAGSLPDWFRVSVPPGFIAVPWEVLVDDGHSVVVLIFREGEWIGG